MTKSQINDLMKKKQYFQLYLHLYNKFIDNSIFFTGFQLKCVNDKENVFFLSFFIVIFFFAI